MPKKELEEWEKSQRLNEEMRQDIRMAALLFCFKPLHEIFVELMEVLAWDVYHYKVDKELLALYNEKPELMSKVVMSTDKIDFLISNLPEFTSSGYRQHGSQTIRLALDMPLFATAGSRRSYHEISTIDEPKNKKERALAKRFEQLNTDISVFTKRVNDFNHEIAIALQNSQSTGKFIERNPEFEGYMKQSLKKFYKDKHPNVIESLNSAMDVRAYASLTTGHRLQAYQQSMLTQLQQLELRHAPVQVSQQA